MGKKDMGYYLNPNFDKKSTQSLGKKGEDIAAGYLEGLGHKVLERNWRWSHLEIDIITYDEMGIHIVEVKASHFAPVLEPENRVNEIKRRNLVRAANAYLVNGCPDYLYGAEIFFDIVAVIFNPSGTSSVKYFPAAWIPMRK